MQNLDSILKKIRKCLALSNSSNPHEAAVALRQANKLMSENHITSEQIEFSDISKSLNQRHSKKPVTYEMYLADIVSSNFSCRLLHDTGIEKSNWIFVGVTPNPEVASYTFSVLFKKLKAARKQYIQSLHFNTKPVNKTKLANSFCEGWVFQVGNEIRKLVPSPELELIDSYITHHNPDIKTLNSTSKRIVSKREIDAISEGRKAAENVTLNHGVNTDLSPMIGQS